MRKPIAHIILIKVSIFLILVSCRKDPTPIEEPIPVSNGCTEPWCDEFPEPPEIGFYYSSDGIQYKEPCFNPLNNEEFVYLRYQQGSFTPELVRYDMTTKQEVILCNAINIITQPQWGRQGWITFTSLDWKVWKIFQDGSQLTQLTFGERDLYPIFNYAGDKITYYRGKIYSNFELQNNPDLIKNNKMFLMDLNGNVLDSVTEPNIHNQYNEQFMYQTWHAAGRDNSDYTYFMEGTGDLQGIYQYTGDTVMKIKEWFGHQGILDIKATNETVYFSRHREGLYKIDIATGVQSHIKWGCDTRYYDVLSVSSDGTKMLVQKIISTPYAEDQAIDEQHEIWLINLNSCDHEKILGD